MYLGPRLVTGPAAHPSLRVYVFLLIPGLAAVVFRSRYWFLPLVSAGLQLIGYRMLGVPFYHWYLAPTVLIVSVATGVALGALVAILRKSAAARLDAGRKLPVQAVAVVAAFGLLLPPLWEGAKLPLQNGLAIQQAYPAETYRAVGEWLAAATPEDATVGYIEIGYIGYYSRRNIIDPLGLVTPGALPHVREADISWAYRERLPDYILVNPRFDGLLGPFDQEPWFSSCYRLAATFEPIQVFRRCEVVPKDDLVVLEQAQPRNDQPAGELLPQRSIGQTFVARQDRLRTVGLLLATYGNQVEGPLVFYLQAKQHAGSGQNLVKLELDMSLVENNSWKLFSFPPIEDSAGKEYYAYLEAPYTLPGQTITAWSTVDDSYPDGTLMLQHQPRSGDLALRLYYVRPGD